MTRKDVLARYRHLRAIAMRHNSAALGFVSGLSHQKLSLHGLLARRDVMLDP